MFRFLCSPRIKLKFNSGGECTSQQEMYFQKLIFIDGTFLSILYIIQLEKCITRLTRLETIMHNSIEKHPSKILTYILNSAYESFSFAVCMICRIYIHYMVCKNVFKHKAHTTSKNALPALALIDSTAAEIFCVPVNKRAFYALHILQQASCSAP